jgi:hypothetical protein
VNLCVLRASVVKCNAYFEGQYCTSIPKFPSRLGGTKISQ